MALRAREVRRKVPFVRKPSVLSIADSLSVKANIDGARIAVEAKDRPASLPVVRNLDLATVDAAGIAELVARPALVLWLRRHARRIVGERIGDVHVERRVPVLALARTDDLPAGRNDNCAPLVLRLARQSLGGGGSLGEGGFPLIHPLEVPFAVERDGARWFERIHHAARCKPVDLADRLVFPGLGPFGREGVAPVDKAPAVGVLPCPIVRLLRRRSVHQGEKPRGNRYCYNVHAPIVPNIPLSCISHFWGFTRQGM